MLVGSDFPTVAIWPDGSIVFIQDGEHREARQAVIPAEAAGRTSREVAAAIRTVPADDEFDEDNDPETHTTDQPTIEIVVRDDTTWRVARVYGLKRDSKAASGSMAAFIGAYRQLLQARPAKSDPFQPVDIEVRVWGFEHARGEPVPWPSDVPAPPANLVPGSRSVSFTLDTKYGPALNRTLDVAYASNPERAIGFNGHKWTMYPIERFCGHSTIMEVIRDARRERGR